MELKSKVLRMIERDAMAIGLIEVKKRLKKSIKNVKEQIHDLNKDNLNHYRIIKKIVTHMCEINGNIQELKKEQTMYKKMLQKFIGENDYD